MAKPAEGANGPIRLSLDFIGRKPAPLADPETCPHTTTTWRAGAFTCKRCGGAR